MFTLKHTVKPFIELIRYLLTDLHLSYLLRGKFQTDCLEARFGSYRQFSGGNYRVSVQEIRGSEKNNNNKFISVLNVVCEKHGNIILRFYMITSTFLTRNFCNYIFGFFMNVLEVFL